MPSTDAFQALARSSPWRWSTLRFTLRPDHVRAWLRRPDVVRVETLDGVLLQVVREQPRQVAVLTSDGGHPVTLPSARAADEPIRRPDGLVAERAPGSSQDAPMYQDYRWVAMLDPVELADGRDHDTGEPSRPALFVDTVSEVDHAGRPAWEAVVRPTPAYEPRCGCCPLLRTQAVDLLEFADHPHHVLPVYPDAYRVRLDVGTGVCVFIAAVGGVTPGAGHDLRIEAVDEPMADHLFVPPRRPLPRRDGWSPAGQGPTIQ